MIKYSKIFEAGPRASGRTHAICVAAKSINATVLCANAVEACHIAGHHDVTVLAVDTASARYTDPVFTNITLAEFATGPILADHSAMLEICRQYENTIEELLSEIDTC